MRNKITNTFWTLIVFVVIVILWHLVSYYGFVSEVLLPSPIKVYEAIFDLFVKNKFGNDLFISLYRIIVGFTLASLLAIPLGVFMAVNKKIQLLWEPFIDFIRYTPIPAFVPLFILWFGVGEIEKVVVIASSVFFQLVLMVVNSISAVPQNIIDSARTLGLKDRDIIFKVIFHYAKPRIFEDLHISMGWALAGLMVAEIVGSVSGMGFVIIQSQRLLQTDKVIADIIVVGLLGVLSDYLFRVLYRFFFPWSLKLRLYA